MEQGGVEQREGEWEVREQAGRELRGGGKGNAGRRSTSGGDKAFRGGWMRTEQDGTDWYNWC